MRITFHDPLYGHAHIKINGVYEVSWGLFIATILPPIITVVGFFIAFFYTGQFWMLIPAFVVGGIGVLFLLFLFISAWVQVFRHGQAVRREAHK